MNVQELRQSLKMQWLSYYEQNRLWLDKMRVWATYDGLRRPSSGFILATLSVLEPQFEELLAFILELNNDPDEIINALGLNFNPDVELGLRASDLNREEPSVSEVLAFAAFADKDAFSSPVNTQHPVLSLVEQPVSSFSDHEDVIHLDEPVAVISSRTANRMMDYTQSELVAVAGSGHSIHSQGMGYALGDRTSLRTLERNSSSEVSQKVKPLPSVKLVLATEKQHNHQAVRVLEITNKVPGRPKTLISPTLATEITPKGKYTNIQTPIPSTNASSLASWVDEFCQGTRWGVGSDEC
ncbi:DUF5331 domain-containing protein [Nostoc sp. TCL26-01]|uniref:DUF5331 domain-containing protein n=1 Tax=Nostoc sp. TCL26-01 TaxID=2576904 RepID=UPI0015BA6987|nr:DUF5331 domain-containing protein [Nostoc sp. TCL26-01]QLE58134.1 hypothetical protein FD725_23030 [Nostoc sp. TCL26-01]